MGKFNIPRIARPVDLASYAPELAEEIVAGTSPIYMWVNLTRGAHLQYAEIVREWRSVLASLTATEPTVDKSQAKAAIEEMSGQAEALNQRTAAWWSEAWSQGPENVRWTVDEVQALMLQCSEQDPALWDFITNECWRMVAQHRESARKN